MIKKLPYKFAINAMLVLLSLVCVFHFLVITQIIPYTIVWAGKLNNLQEMLVFETVSLLVNAVLIYVILSKGLYIKSLLSEKILTIILWFFVLVFSLNTVGNLFSETSFETLVFTPLTFISAILCFRVIGGE